MGNSQQTSSTSNIDSKSKFVFWLSLIIVSLSFVFIFLIIIKSFCMSIQLSDLKDLSSLFLPVIASWVGAVIAYYFGKENYDSANARVQEMVDKINPIDNLKKVLIKDVLIKYDTMVKFINSNSPLDYKKVLLTDILNLCISSKANRIPIVTNDKKLQTVIHRSMIDLLISKNALKLNSSDLINKLTIQELIDDEETSKYFNSPLLCIREDASLFDAKSAYDNDPTATDVFVTKTGGLNEELIGFITEQEIINYLKA